MTLNAEFWRRRAARGELDGDVADMLIADFAERGTARRRSREKPRLPLLDLPRPRPLKHAGDARRPARRTA